MNIVSSSIGLYAHNRGLPIARSVEHLPSENLVRPAVGRDEGNQLQRHDGHNDDAPTPPSPRANPGA